MSIDEGSGFATVTYKNTGPYLATIPVRELPSEARLPLMKIRDKEYRNCRASWAEHQNYAREKNDETSSSDHRFIQHVLF